MFGFDVRVAKIAWTVFLVALLLFITWKISSTLLVIVFAVFFSYLVYPLVEMLEHRLPERVPRTVTVGIVFLFVLALIALLASVFGVQIQEQAVNLGQQIPKLLDPANVSAHIPLPNFLEPLRERILGFVRTQLENGGDNAMPLAKVFGLGVVHAAGNLIYLILVPILSFLLIKDAPLMRKEILALLGRSDKKLWSGIVEDLDVLLSRYVRALLLLAIATLICYSIALSLLGVPYALLLACAAAVLEFIPFAGPLASVALALAVAMFSGYDHLVWLLVFFLAYRTFQDYVLNPYLMSEGVEVSPFLVIVGLLAGDQLAGVVGIFLSVPVIAALKIVFTRAWAFHSQQLQKKKAAAEDAGVQPADIGDAIDQADDRDTRETHDTRDTRDTVAVVKVSKAGKLLESDDSAPAV